LSQSSRYHLFPRSTSCRRPPLCRTSIDSTNPILTDNAGKEDDPDSQRRGVWAGQFGRVVIEWHAPSEGAWILGPWQFRRQGRREERNKAEVQAPDPRYIPLRDSAAHPAPSWRRPISPRRLSVAHCRPGALVPFFHAQTSWRSDKQAPFHPSHVGAGEDRVQVVPTAQAWLSSTLQILSFVSEPAVEVAKTPHLECRCQCPHCLLPLRRHWVLRAEDAMP
jgi:hypothetical protein